MERNLSYNCVLSAPLGDKKGTLTAKIVDDKIEGNLHIMEYDNYFYGNIGKDGRCLIYGDLKTLPETLRYEATGHINENSLSLTLNIGKKKIILNGSKDGKAV